MSVSSTDHVVVPENNENDNNEGIQAVVETVETVETVDAAPEITFDSLGLPERVDGQHPPNRVSPPLPLPAATIPHPRAG
ncbi:RNA helicase, partial [Streptomyces sp. NPDC059837]